MLGLRTQWTMALPSGEMAWPRGGAPVTAADAEGQRNATIQAWAMAQMAPWLMYPPSGAALRAELDRLNETEPNVFLISIADGRANLIERPAAIRAGIHEMALRRAETYRIWLNGAAREQCPTMRTTVAVYIGDAALHDPQVPVFSFQKPARNRSLLLPDVDLLNFVDFGDPQPYESKGFRAIFVGSTSGGALTADVIRTQGGTPRVQAARYFRESSDVVFALPHIVQCDSEEAVAMLREAGLGDGKFVSWPEQRASRFIVSMDGNGATCSRVIMALGSNCALVKYASPHVLYYFDGLQPWLHYIPITEHADVERIVGLERQSPGLFAPVAEAGRAFAQTYFTRDAVMRYTVDLLRLYETWMGDVRPGPVGGAAADGSGAAAGADGFTILAHIANRGDVRGVAEHWAGNVGSQQGIQGFALWPRGSIAGDDVSYQAVRLDGTLSERSAAGAYCGTRGASLSIAGFVIHFGGASATKWRCLCWARFKDGSVLGPVEAGTVCRTTGLAELEAMRVALVPR